MSTSLWSSKPIALTSAIVIAITLSSLPCGALTVKEVPNPRQTRGEWVTDMAGILKPETETKLNQMIDQLESKNGSEIGVVTVPETTPSASPKVFATELFNYWKIGKKGQDNGVLFLISVRDRRVEIETGYGVEGILPDAKVGQIINTQITPKFKQKDFDGGTLAGTQAIAAILTGDETLPNRNGNIFVFADPTVPYKLGFLLIFGGMVASMLVIKLRPIYLDPKGRSRVDKWERFFEGINKCCVKCKKPMQLVNERLVRENLTKAERTAEDIGSTIFEGWRCVNCNPQGMHIRACEQNTPHFTMCPHCHQLTVTRGNYQIIKQASFLEDGMLTIPYDCQCCKYHRDEEQVIPSTWSSSSSSSSSSGGSFGGGSSGGGGAGGDW
jgi:uncharacterized protein